MPPTASRQCETLRFDSADIFRYSSSELLNNHRPGDRYTRSPSEHHYLSNFDDRGNLAEAKDLALKPDGLPNRRFPRSGALTRRRAFHRYESRRNLEAGNRLRKNHGGLNGDDDPCSGGCGSDLAVFQSRSFEPGLAQPARRNVSAVG